MSIGIVGGGITGLTTAYYLSKQGERVELYEADERVGGLVRSFKHKNWEWALEEFFHHYFVTDKEVVNLAKEVGLEEKLFYQRLQTSVYSQGNIYPFDQPNDFLKFPHLDYFNKLRMGGVIFGLRCLPYLPIYDQFKASGLFPKLIGKRSWEVIWKPLMKGKFHQLAEQVSFSWIWARIKKRSFKLGYFEGGTERLVDELVKEIIKRGKIFTNTKIEKIKKKDEGWELVSQSKKLSARKVVLAIPMLSALKLMQSWKELRDKQVSQWRELKNVGALTLVLRAEKKFLPGDSYWLNILEKDFPFVVVVEQTNFISSSHYNGENVVYVGGYYLEKSPIFSKNKEEILNKFSPYLRRLNPSFENYLIDYDLFKNPHAQPVIPTNYSKIKPKVTLIPNQLYWATPNHIFPWDRGLNYSIKLGKQVATNITSK